MSALLAVAAADWRARTRSASIVLTIACALAAGYWFVPEANYETVDLDGHRGIYNSAWMGAMTAILVNSLVLPIGFYLVRGALTRESRYALGDIVRATPVTNSTFALGKWLSNTAFLTLLAAIVFAGAVVMQLIRAEDRALDFSAYVVPFALLVVPVCAIVGAVAIVFDAIVALRGIGGSVLWFFAWTAAAALPLQLGGARGALGFDPLGLSTAIAAMTATLHANDPHANIASVSIGIAEMREAPKTFVFAGIPWNARLVAWRSAWLGASVPIALVAAGVFDRFASFETTVAVPAPAVRLAARALASLPDLAGTRLLRAELGVLVAGAGPIWCVAVAALAFAGSVSPADVLARAIVPLASIVPLARYAVAGTVDRATGVDALVRAAPAGTMRTMLARFGAVTLVCGFPLLGAIAREPSLALVPFAFGGVALALGTLSGTPRLYETLFLLFWYAGVNRVPGFELAADARTAPLATLALSAAFAIAGYVIALVATIWRARRA